MQVNFSCSYPGLSTWPCCTLWSSYWPSSTGWQGPSRWHPFPEDYHFFHVSTTADRNLCLCSWCKSSKVEDIHNASIRTQLFFFFFLIWRTSTAWLKVWKTSSIQEKVIYFLQKENMFLLCEWNIKSFKEMEFSSTIWEISMTGQWAAYQSAFNMAWD